MTLGSGQKLSHYRLVEKIGEGGMGVVWKAEDTVLNRFVAIKVLPADASRDEHRRKMFLDEARLASSLSDAHVVQVHELGREGDLDFIVMELVEGKPLSKILHGRPLPADKVAELGLQVARALGKAHKRGLIHRDLKPANILVTPDGDVKVVDFGLAALFDVRAVSTAGSDEPTLAGTIPPSEASTQPDVRPRKGELAGTLPYMAPEQVRREKLDTRSDVFSLGIVLYEMTTGQRPFTGATRAEIASEIVSCRPKPVHELVAKVPLELDRIVRKALAAKRAERYQTMEDLAVDLKRLGKELESGSSPSYESVQTGVARPRGRLVAAAAGIVVIVAGLGLGAWKMGWLKSSPPLDEKTILVLPFEVRGQEEGADYVGRAFAEAIVVDLAQEQELKVLPVPEPAERSNKAHRRPAEEAISEGAGRVVTGSLTRDGKLVRATVSLVGAKGNRVEWGTEKEDREGDLSGLASAVVLEMSDKLGIKHTGLYGDFLEIVMSGPTASHPAAAEFVVAYKRNDARAELAAAKRLVEAFPAELASHAAMSTALEDDWEDEPSPEHLESLKAQPPILERLDARNPYGPFVQGDADRNSAPHSALAAFTKLLERSDLSARLRARIVRSRSLAESNLGDHRAAVSDARAAVALDPTNGRALVDLSKALSRAGRQAESEVAARQAVALVPTYPFAWQRLGLSLARQTKFKEALQAFQKACELAENQEICGNFVIALQRNGLEGEATSWAGKAASMPNSVYGTYNLACYHALAGHRDEALRWLRKAVNLGYSSFWITKDSDLDSLRGDPEFEKIVAEVKKKIGKK